MLARCQKQGPPCAHSGVRLTCRPSRLILRFPNESYRVSLISSFDLGHKNSKTYLMKSDTYMPSQFFQLANVFKCQAIVLAIRFGQFSVFSLFQSDINPPPPPPRHTQPLETIILQFWVFPKLVANTLNVFTLEAATSKHPPSVFVNNVVGCHTTRWCRIKWSNKQNGKRDKNERLARQFFVNS